MGDKEKILKATRKYKSHYTEKKKDNVDNISFSSDNLREKAVP